MKNKVDRTLGGDEIKLLKRKKIRLEGYDYSSEGAYFVTICIADKYRPLCVETVGADIIRPNKETDNSREGVGADIIRPPQLSEYGKIIQLAIEQIPLIYDNIVVDKYCIMPNHIHLIIFITSGANRRIISAPTPTLSVVIGSMKRWVSKQIGVSIWQKSYNDRIIRNEKEYREVWRYIDENPLKIKIE